MQLHSKTAIITGANAGIGKAIALKFTHAGANVAIFATNEERGNATVQEILSINASLKVKFYKVDVSSKTQVDQAIADVLKEFGSVDILVNNAGIVRDNLLMKMSEDDWDRVLNINLKSVYNTCHALV